MERAGPARAAERRRQVDARGRAGAARGRPPGDRAARLHDGRRRRRHRAHRAGVPPGGGRGPRRQPDRPGAGRGVGDRLGRVRARGDARPQRQRRDRLLDREHRPDGRAHGRQRHRRAAADPLRHALPAAARPGAGGDPRGGRRDGRLEHPVRGQPGDRRDRRDRDEPARVALVGAGLEGHRVPDRQDRRAAGGRLRARGDRQRHHAQDAGQLRADDRLRGGQVAALRVREVPGRRRAAPHLDAVGGRGDGDRPHLQAGVREGDALARARRAAGLRRGRRPAASGSSRPPTTATSCSSRRSGAATPRRSSASRTGIDPWFMAEMAALARGEDPEAGLERSFKSVDTCAAEFEAETPYYYSGWERRAAHEVRRGDRPERGDPRERAEPDRPGHRVRLLLRARGDDRARVGPRRRDDQLQPGDGLDRLRHLGPPLLRAAHAGGRARGDRARAARGRDRPVRRPDAAEAGGRPGATRACRCSARRSSRSTAPRTGRASARCSTSWG